jgi:hypothetical protein
MLMASEPKTYALMFAGLAVEELPRNPDKDRALLHGSVDVRTQ